MTPTLTPFAAPRGGVTSLGAALREVKMTPTLTALREVTP